MISGIREAVSNLDQLASRHYHFKPAGQLVQGEEDRCRIVIDYDAGSAEQSFEQLSRVNIAISALAGGNIIFQIGISGDCRLCLERRSSKIGVQHDTGRVNHIPQ